MSLNGGGKEYTDHWDKCHPTWTLRFWIPAQGRNDVYGKVFSCVLTGDVY